MKKINFGFPKSVKKPADSAEHGIYSSGSGYSNSVDSTYGGAISTSIDYNSSSQHQSLSRLPTNYEDSNFQLMQQDTMRFLLQQSAREQEARILDLTATLETKDSEIARLRSDLEQKDVEMIQLRQQIDLLQLVQKQRNDDSSNMKVTDSAHEVSMKDRISQLESELLAITDKHTEESKQWLYHKATLVKRIAMLSRTESECEEAQLKAQSLTIEIDQLKSMLVIPSTDQLKDDNAQLLKKLADLESGFESERTGWIDSRALLEERLSEHNRCVLELESVRRESSELSTECSVLKAELQAAKDGFAIERKSFLRDYNSLIERSKQESEVGDERIALLTAQVALLTDELKDTAAIKLADQIQKPSGENSCSDMTLPLDSDSYAMKQLGSIEEKQQPPYSRSSSADIDLKLSICL